MTINQIAILIPLCSKKQDWKDLGDVDFFKYFLPAWIFTTSKKHTYKFYIGYDENDEFFSSRHGELQSRLPNEHIFVLPKSCNGNPCLAWTMLYEEALKK